MIIPEVLKMRQKLYDTRIIDAESETLDQLNASGIVIDKGVNIAIAAGSRGIANIHRIIKAVVTFVKSKGANPLIIPAMGSHGGATSEGQRKLLESYGITEEYTGAPIVSSMDVVELPRGDLENRVFIDRFAYGCKGVIIVNRVKVHTDFHADVESGIVKMLVIGLGKHEQAKEIHNYGLDGLARLIAPTARQIMKSGKILGAVGIVENGYHETAVIRAANASNIEKTDRELLELNKRTLPRIPTDHLDVLIVDEIGKDLSGSAMDTNVIGRTVDKFERAADKPHITNIVACSLTPLTHGNANGVGLADFITRKLFDAICFQATYNNCLTSQNTTLGRVPIIAESDRQAAEYAIRTCSRPCKLEDIRLMRIKNTLRLDEFYASKAVCEEIKDMPGIEIIGGFEALFYGDELKQF